jgi:hypothetical protein
MCARCWCAAGFRAEGRGRGIHERPAGRLCAVRHRRHDHGGAGDARPVFHGLRPGNLPAAATDHADPGRRIPLAPGEQARGQDGRERGRTIRERGVIVAGGLMAGGALGGVFGAALRLFPKFSEDMVHTPFYANEPVSQTVSVVMFIGLCLYVWFSSIQRKKDA